MCAQQVSFGFLKKTHLTYLPAEWILSGIPLKVGCDGTSTTTTTTTTTTTWHQVVAAAAVPAAVEPRVLNRRRQSLQAQYRSAQASEVLLKHTIQLPTNPLCPIYHHSHLAPPFLNLNSNPPPVESNFSTYSETALLSHPPTLPALVFAYAANILPRRNNNWSSFNFWNSD